MLQNVSHSGAAAKATAAKISAPEAAAAVVAGTGTCALAGSLVGLLAGDLSSGLLIGAGTGFLASTLIVSGLTLP